MINQITKGIYEAIRKEFGSTYGVYTEEEEQGFQVPCFFVACIKPAFHVFPKGKKVTNRFRIQYFPSTEKPMSENYEVYERLSACLESIMVDNVKIGGTDMEVEKITSKDMTITIYFNGFIPIKEPDGEMMDSYTVGVYALEGDTDNGNKK